MNWLCWIYNLILLEIRNVLAFESLITCVNEKSTRLNNTQFESQRRFKLKIHHTVHHALEKYPFIWSNFAFP